MSIIGYIVKELKTPDDQGRDWYAWSTNQLSHVLLGTFFAGFGFVIGFNYIFALLLPALVFLNFEIQSYSKNPTWATLRDKINDVGFFWLGEAFSYSIYAKIWWVFVSISLLIVMFQLIGIIKRVKKAIIVYKDNNQP